jgi:hypothetical protein
MTISGLFSGPTLPLSAGLLLRSRSAPLDPLRAVPPPERRDRETEPSDDGDAVESPFDTLDTVELSDESLDADESLGAGELTPEDKAEVEQLQQRDSEVRQHEAAHQAAAGAHAKGGASFEYTTGPDGRRYAVGGEVQIDTSAVEGDPEATIAKMRQLQAAALAPADPSAQDRQVAAGAAAKIQEARSEQAQADPDEQSSDETSPDLLSAVDAAFQPERQRTADLIDVYA